MEFLKLLANGMKFLIELPLQLIRTIGKWNLFRRLSGESLKTLGAEVKAPSAAVRFLRGTGRVVFWLLLLAMMAAAFIGLWYVNERYELDRFLGGPWVALRKIWLPYLFFLFCLLCLLGWWLWRLLGTDRITGEFPDIDAAWHDARTALDEAGIGCTDVPLFLVLGRPAVSVESLFSASRLPWPVHQVPRQAHAPLQVYANGNGIYLACGGTSLLGEQAAILAADTAAGADGAQAGSRVESVFEDVSEAETPAPEPQPPAPPAGPDFFNGENLLAAQEEKGPGTGLLTEELTEEADVLVATSEPGPRLAPSKRHPLLLKNTSEVERLTARLKYLCKLIRRDRQPYCPVNGILVLVPYAATASEEDASQTANICQHDLAAVRSVLKTDCPVLALICDMETAPGFLELLKHFREEQRHRLLGQAFPLRPDIKPLDVPHMLDSGVHWIGQALATLVYKLLHLEKQGHETWAEAVHVNARLYQLSSAIQERELRLGRLLARVALSEAGTPLLFGGCYFAATGPDADHEQAFVPAVFRQLLENQNYVSWTPEALAEERDYQRRTTYGYALLGLFTLSVLLLGYWKWQAGSLGW